MSRPRSLAAAAAAVLMTLALAGCGEDDPKPLSTADFKEKAVEICEEYNEKVQGYDPGTDPTDDEMEDAVQKVAKALEQEADELGELVPPTKIADDVEDMLDDLREGAKKIADAGKDINTLTENPLEDASEAATELDLAECAA